MAKTTPYDTKDGEYCCTQHDHVGYRYEILDVLGTGCFGQVGNTIKF